MAWINAHWPYCEAAIGIGACVAVGALLGLLVAWARGVGDG